MPERRPELTGRARVAVAVGRVAAAGSRRLAGRGGSVIGGTLALRIHPGLLGELGRGTVLACVSGTNGKTTATRMLTAALGAPTPVSNSAGANLTTGLVSALMAAPGRRAVLEVDELYLSGTVEAVAPRVVVLLNLTRDQLDRSAETRRIAERWRWALKAAAGRTAVVANADDPLVVRAAAGAGRVHWVGAGQPWTADSHACPACGRRLRRAGEADGGEPSGSGWWGCAACGLSRPAVEAELLGDVMVTADGERRALPRSLPGRANRANSLLATVAAGILGVPPGPALARIAAITEVGTRYSVQQLSGVGCRVLLAKNPAGWLETFGLLGPGAHRPVVVCVGARAVDGRDTSWLYDVPFERLAGRPVVASGRRAADLALRLRYAGVPHRLVPDIGAAVQAAAIARGGCGDPADTRAGTLDLVADYSSLQEVGRLGRRLPRAAAADHRLPAGRGR